MCKVDCLLLPDPLDKTVNLRVDQSLLFLERRVRESAGQELAHLMMLLRVTLAHNGMSLVSEIAPIIEAAFDETTRLPFANTVDIGPGLDRVE